MTIPKIPTPDQLRALPPSRRKEVEELVRQLEQVRRQNPLAFWEPYGPKQDAFLGSRAWIKAFFGGNGSGKSVVGTVDDLIQLCDREVLPPHLARHKRWEPPFFLRVVAPKMNVIESTVLEKFRELTPRDQLRGGSFDKAFSKQRMMLHFENGSWVVFNTGDQDRDAHAGIELHRVRFDEEPPEAIYTENVARLRRFAPDAQVCFTMTPLAGLSWTFDTIYEQRDDPSAGVFVVIASMMDNPYIDHQAMLHALRHLSEAERAAVIEGHFVSFHGRVLHQFSPDRHVVDPPSPEQLEGMDVYIGIDPGISRGGIVFMAFDRDNTALVFDEIYSSGDSVKTLAKRIREKQRYWRAKDPIFVIDPSARNRSLTDAERVEAAWQREGIFPLAGQNDRTAGFLELRRRVEANTLLVSRECVNWLKEADRLVLAEDEISRERDKKTNAKGTGAFATVGPDHLIDPTRYVCMERPWFQASEVDQPIRPWRPGDPNAPSAAQMRALIKPTYGPMGKFA